MNSSAAPVLGVKKPSKAYRGIAMEGGIARWYARNTRGRADFEAVSKMLAPLIPSGGSFLEVAPGPGYHTIELAKLRDCQAHGLDISETFVAIASENARQAGVDVEFCVGNASSMPYADASFELVVCQAAFKNFTQPVEALAEMRRVLKPGGVALVADLRHDASMSDIEEEVATMRLSAANAWFTRLTFRLFLLRNAYTAGEMREMAKRAGFQTVRVDVSAIGMNVWLGGDES